MPYLALKGEHAPIGSLREEVERAAGSGELSTTLFIVPTGGWARQLTRQTIAYAGAQTLIQPNIFSLQEVITSLAGGIRPHKRLISDAESAVLVELGIRDLFRLHKLTYYEEREGATYPLPRGTFELIVAAIAGLQKKGVRAGQLRELVKTKKKRIEGIQGSSELRKTHDLALIYQAYSDRLGNELVDTYGQYFDLLDLLDHSPMYVSELFQRAYPGIKRIIVSGFASIDEPARQILNAIADTTDVEVFFEIAAIDKNPILYKLHHDFATKQQHEGVQLVTHEEPNSSPLHEHLGRSLFKNIDTSELFDASEQIVIRSAATLPDEVTLAARTVKQIIRSQPAGYDISRIAVVTYRQEGYSQMIRQIFRNYGIPVSLTERLPLASSPLFVAVDSLLRLAERGLRPHLVLRLLSTPYLEFGSEGERIDRSNLYSVISEHRLPPGRSSWQEELSTILGAIEIRLDAVDDEYDERRLRMDFERVKRAKADLAMIESLIAALQKPLTPRQFVDLLRKIFYDHGLVDRLLQASREMLHADALEPDTRSYRALDRLLDEFLMLAGTLDIQTKQLPISYYGERLRVAALKMRYAPHLEPGRGVLITSIEQVIGMDIDHLVVLGMNDTVFPEIYSQSALVPSEHHKPEYDHLAEQRYLFYQMLLTPSISINLSYEHGISADGKLPSPFLRELERVVRVTKPEGEPQRILSPREFLQYYGERSLPERTELVSLASAHLRRDIEQHIDPTLEAWQQRINDGSEVLALSPEERTWLERQCDRVYSVSQLEMYALCPFKYFERHILRLGEGREAADEGLSPRDKGMVLHDKLRRILEHMRDLRSEGTAVPDHREMNAASFRSYDPDPDRELNVHGGIRAKHPFWRVDLEGMFDPPLAGDLFERFLEEERKLFGNGAAKHLLPFSFEQEFKEITVSHPDDETRTPIKLRGKIDRIDYDSSTGNMVVIDYKSRRAPKPDEIQEGLSLQLPLYLRIAEDLLVMHTGVRGVAAYYHTLLGKDAGRIAGIGAQDFLLSLLEKQPRQGSAIYDNPENYEALGKAIDKTIGYAYDYVEGMKEGRFPLVREDRTEKNCSYCPYRRSCRVYEASENGTLPKAGSGT